MIPRLELRSAQPQPIQSLTRGLAVLSAVLDAPAGLSLTEIALRVGLHKATVLRFVRTLVEAGYVSAEPGGPLYVPGYMVLRYLAVSGAESELSHRALPILAELSRASAETAALFVPVWPDLICVAYIPSPQLIRRYRELGEIQPMTRAAIGRAFLSFVPETYLAATLEARPLEARTPHTITDADAFRAAVAAARRQYFAISSEETNAEMSGVATPILVPDRLVPLGVISVSGPLSRWTVERIQSFAPQTVSAAHKLAAIMHEAQLVARIANHSGELR